MGSIVLESFPKFVPLQALFQIESVPLVRLGSLLWLASPPSPIPQTKSLRQCFGSGDEEISFSMSSTPTLGVDPLVEGGS